MTSSPGSHSAANAVYTACLPPLVTSTCDAVQSKPESRLVLAAIASFSSGARRPACSGGSRTSRARGDRGVDDVLRGREVGLAGPEPDHVLALGLQGLGLGVDRQGGRWCDRGESCGGSFHNRQACHSHRPLPTGFRESGIAPWGISSTHGVHQTPDDTRYPTQRTLRSGESAVATWRARAMLWDRDHRRRHRHHDPDRPAPRRRAFRLRTVEGA